MKAKQKFLLVIKGKPISATHDLLISAPAFIERTKTNITDEDDLNPFSSPRERFLGRFHGYHQKEFSIKLKPSFFRKHSSNQLIWIYGKIEPLNEAAIRLHLHYHRTAHTKHSLWAITALICAILLWVGTQILKYGTILEFLMVLGFILFFYLLFILMLVISVKGQLTYFNKYFLGAIPVGVEK
jgi:hypothetical protein